MRLNVKNDQYHKMIIVVSTCKNLKFFGSKCEEHGFNLEMKSASELITCLPLAEFLCGN